MTINLIQALPLELKVQKYAWGKIGNTSLVARLLSERNIEATTPYAELWMGAHPNGCADVIIPAEQNEQNIKMSLAEALDTFPLELLGADIIARFGNSLPFLTKVLSINKALSIQAHPDKKLAVKLHAKDANNYPDDNHKPELAIALSSLRLLAGFRPWEEIKSLMRSAPELISVVGAPLAEKVFENCSTINAANLLKKLYSAIVDARENSLLAECTKNLIARLKRKVECDNNEKLAIELHSSYDQQTKADEDIGVVSSLLMNYVKVEAGQAVYIGPNVPHAHLSGDLLECMASSDNVVRAGLTSKFQDFPTMIEMLNYAPASFKTFTPEECPGDPYVLRYKTPAKEFVVDIFKSPPSDSTPVKIEYNNNKNPQLLFCLEGEADIEVGSRCLELKAGHACLIPAAARAYSLKVSNSRLFRISVPV